MAHVKESLSFHRRNIIQSFNISFELKGANLRITCLLVLTIFILLHKTAPGTGRKGEIRFQAFWVSSQKMFRLEQMASQMVQALSGIVDPSCHIRFRLTISELRYDNPMVYRKEKVTNFRKRILKQNK